MGHYETSELSDLKMTSITTRGTATLLPMSPTPKFSPFRSINNRIRVTGRFVTSTPNMTSNTTRSRVSHMCLTNVTMSLYFKHLALWSTVFKLLVILKQVHQKSLKMALNTTRSKIPQICSTGPPDSHVSVHFHSVANCFQVTAHFSTSARNERI